MTAKEKQTERNRKFGEFVRRERMAKKIGLREMAKKIQVSPTYLSMIERGENSPPALEKLTEIARLLGCDEGELIALAGRVPSEVLDTLRNLDGKKLSMFYAHMVPSLAEIITKHPPKDLRMLLSAINDAPTERLTPLINLFLHHIEAQSVPSLTTSGGAIDPAIAKWIARDGVASDLSEIVTEHPEELAALLTAIKGFGADEWHGLLMVIRGLQTKR